MTNIKVASLVFQILAASAKGVEPTRTLQYRNSVGIPRLSVCGNIKKGNCRGQKDKMLVDIDEENRPLPKRQYPHK